MHFWCSLLSKVGEVRYQSKCSAMLYFRAHFNVGCAFRSAPTTLTATNLRVDTGDGDAGVALTLSTVATSIVGAGNAPALALTATRAGRRPLPADAMRGAGWRGRHTRHWCHLRRGHLRTTAAALAAAAAHRNRLRGALARTKGTRMPPRVTAIWCGRHSRRGKKCGRGTRRRSVGERREGEGSREDGELSQVTARWGTNSQQKPRPGEK